MQKQEKNREKKGKVECLDLLETARGLIEFKRTYFNYDFPSILAAYTGRVKYGSMCFELP